MLKRISLCLFGLLCLMLNHTAYAQSTPEAIQVLQVDVWPDFDKPNTLVLLTGVLPEVTALPTQVRIPIPENAQVNAVARITASNVMVDDIEFEVSPTEVTFVTPDRAFRVEYYVPYEQEGTLHSAEFVWQSSLGVTQMSVSVQQPRHATELTVEPTAVNSNINEVDGLTYHTLSSVIVPPNTQYKVVAQYQLPTGELTSPPIQTTAPEIPEESNNNIALYLIALGVFLIGVSLFWQVWRDRKAKQEPKTDARFCHNCGKPARAKDAFCRDCGAKLR